MVIERIEAYWKTVAGELGLVDTPYTAFAFGDSPALADELLAVVLSGDKRATAGLMLGYGSEPVAQPGDYAIALDGSGEPRCVLRTQEVVIKPLSAADHAFAWDEGEGDRSLEWWMDAHVDFCRRQAEADGVAFSTDLDTVFERFELVWPRCPADIRWEVPVDADAVRDLTRAAFETSSLGYHGEADMIDAVRAQAGTEVVSLVAEREGAIVGHIMFSPVDIDGNHGMGLGPMAVAPRWQHQRIGVELIRAGLRALRERHSPFVVVLGHPHYYSRFGFRPAAQRGITCEFPGVPEEVFLVLSLQHSAPLPHGVARYLPAFGG